MDTNELDIWITTKYPEPYKNVMVYDIHEGYAIAYYDNVMNTFYDIKTGQSLPYTIAWRPLPSIPHSVMPLKQSIPCRYYPTLEGRAIPKDERKDK